MTKGLSLRSGLAACTLLMLVALGACTPFAATADAGYGRFALDGKFGYVSGSSATSVDQDVREAFGLGDDQGVPYARAQVDFGAMQWSVSGFSFEDSGTGTLQEQFGSSPVLIAGTPVRSEFELWTLKGGFAFEIPIVPGTLSISPGVAVEYVDVHVRVQDLISIATEDADLRAPLPLPFVRAQGGFGPITATAEVGYIKVSVEDVDVSLLDVEAMLRVNPLPLLHFFLGYRWFAFEGDGRVDGDTVNADLTLGGFVIGGGLDF